MKLFLACLCFVLLLGNGPVARACRYCEMAASDPESARLSAQVGGQSFPLEGIVNQYQPVAPTANLAVPPPAANVATKASDLPATAVRRAPAPPPANFPSKGVVVAGPAVVSPAASSHLADAGLAGLVAAGGFFLWRTRRPTASPA